MEVFFKPEFNVVDDKNKIDGPSGYDYSDWSLDDLKSKDEEFILNSIAGIQPKDKDEKNELIDFFESNEDLKEFFIYEEGRNIIVNKLES